VEPVTRTDAALQDNSMRQFLRNPYSTLASGGVTYAAWTDDAKEGVA
jgi:hypothetical protein